MPKLSIITVVLNNRKALELTIESIKKFIFNSPYSLSVEHCIVDGGSSDSTIDYIKSIDIDNYISFKYISEKDRGIYDAMNKGIEISSGRYVNFLNAGDTICDSIDMNYLFNSLQNDLSDRKSAGLALISLVNFKHFGYKITPRNFNSFSPGMPTIHQSMIYKKNILVEINFSVSYAICGDYENFSRIIISKRNFTPILVDYSIFNPGGISSNSPIVLFKESIEISLKYFKLNFFSKIFLIIKLSFSLFLFQTIYIFNKLI
jgi:glycosyltransferase involved in cell wall biosynthesis